MEVLVSKAFLTPQQLGYQTVLLFLCLNITKTREQIVNYSQNIVRILQAARKINSYLCSRKKDLPTTD